MIMCLLIPRSAKIGRCRVRAAKKKTTTPKKLSELIRTLLSAVCLREGRVDERRREQPTTKQ
jgi:hypothetical protein